MRVLTANDAAKIHDLKGVLEFGFQGLEGLFTTVAATAVQDVARQVDAGATIPGGCVRVTSAGLLITAFLCYRASRKKTR